MFCSLGPKPASFSSSTDVLVRARGPRPENILLLVHEVIESLIADSFRGVKYEYRLPCPGCLQSVSLTNGCPLFLVAMLLQCFPSQSSRDPAMFSSRVLRRAVELKALFLQCHASFHVLSITDV